MSTELYSSPGDPRRQPFARWIKGVLESFGQGLVCGVDGSIVPEQVFTGYAPAAPQSATVPAAEDHEGWLEQ